MSASALQKKPVSTRPPLPTLRDAMTDQLASFRAYVRFESVDPAENRRRFYDILWQPTLFGEGALVRSWGRQGQPGTTRATFYPHRCHADAEIRQVVRRRLRHGYTVADWQ